MKDVPLFPLAFADQLSDGVIVATKGSLRYVNPSGLLLLGAERLEQVSGKPLSMFLGQDVISKLLPWEELRRQDDRGATGATMTGHLYGLDGRRVAIRLSSLPILWERGPAYLFVVRKARAGFDVVDQPLLTEAQQVASSKIRTVGMLAAGIIHEVNNTLTAVLGYGQLALRLIPADNKAHRHVQQVIASGRKSSELIQQILMFARPSPETRGPLSFHILANEFLALLRSAIPSWIVVKEEIADVTSPIEADPAQMRLLLANLIADAVHAMCRTGGVLHIQLHDEDVSTEQAASADGLPAGRYVCLRVMDSGGGMDAQEMRQPPDPSATTEGFDREREIRRSAVLGIVSDHGGTVIVNGSLESGTRVSVFIPAKASSMRPEGESRFSSSRSQASSCQGPRSGFPEPLIEESDAVGPRD
ncbi:MAG: PAS domain-containing protein [Nitrospira sp.]|nr:PAS domain-containing protein [Nitrospira sp.]